MRKQIAKKKKSTKHLDFYNQCMNDGMRMLSPFSVYRGLCAAEIHRKLDEKLFDLMHPTWNDGKMLRREKKSSVYWGSDSKDFKIGEFTPLRQTIVLLMAAMNNEL